MTRKKILGSHVKRLMSGVADHGRQHLTEVETDLIQTGLLLEEAIEKLSFNFMAIHKAVEAEQATIAQLLAGGEVTEEQRTQLAALQGQVGGYVNAAITSLQFQDMTSQLVSHAQGGIRALLMAADEAAAAFAGAENVAKGLAHAKERMHALAEVDRMHLNPVKQESMNSGEIELF